VLRGAKFHAVIDSLAGYSAPRAGEVSLASEALSMAGELEKA
jgi:hypothetical protein